MDVEPKLTEVRRTDCVVLRHSVGAAVSSRTNYPNVRASSWLPGIGPVASEQALDKACENTDGAILWIHVELPGGECGCGSAPTRDATHRTTQQWTAFTAHNELGLIPAHTPACHHESVGALFGRLATHCPGLDTQMVSDLLIEDAQPKVQVYGPEQDGVRAISTVAIIARTPRDGAPSVHTKRELIIQTVGSVVGDGWIVTAWHPSRVFTGSTAPTQGDLLLRSPFIANTYNRWLADTPQPKTAGDLGVFPLF